MRSPRTALEPTRAQRSRAAAPLRGALVALLLLGTPSARALPPASEGGVAQVKVFAQEPDDPRVALAKAAIAAWNRTFDDLGLAAPFADPVLTVSSPATRSLENYAWQISRSAGRLVPGAPGPPAPPELTAVDADVVVLLSSQKLMPFAWPWDEGRRRHFVGLPSDPDLDADALRHVFAHELGHVLGLAHDRSDPRSLMCQPCEHRGAADGGILELTEAERSLLIERYRSAP